MTTSNPVFQRIAKLEPSHIRLLEFLSFAYGAVDQAHLLTYFNLYAKETRQPQIQGVGAVNKLLEAGLLEFEGNLVRCKRHLVEDISAHAATAGRAELMCRILQKRPMQIARSYRYFVEQRLSLYLGFSESFLRANAFAGRYNFLSFGDPSEGGPTDYFRELVQGMSTTAALDNFSQDFSYHLAYDTLSRGLEFADHVGPCCQWLETREIPSKVQGVNTKLFLQHLVRNKQERAELALKLCPAPDLLWCYSAFQGEAPNTALKLIYSQSVTNVPFLGFLYLLASLRAGDEKGIRLCLAQADDDYGLLYSLVCELQEGDAEESLAELWDYLYEFEISPLFMFLSACCLYWAGQQGELKKLNLGEAAAQYQKYGYHFLAEQLKLLEEIGQGRGEAGPFLKQFRRKEPWELLVGGLERLFLTPNKGDEPAQRIVWELNLDKSQPVKVKVQKWGKKGDWTSGRKLEINDLGKYYPDQMDQHDRRVFEIFAASGYQSQSTWGKLIMSLVGHPRLFDSQERPLRLKEGQASLEISQVGTELSLRSPLIKAPHIAYRKISPTDFEVMLIDEQLQGLLTLVSRHQDVKIPSEQVPGVAKALARASRQKVQITSNVSLPDLGEEVAGASDLVLRLTPEGLGLRSTALVTPAGAIGPAFPPGREETYLTLEKAGEILTYKRDLKQEKKNWKKLQKSVTHLEASDQVIEEPLHCLEFLESLSELKSDEVRVEWPEGVKFRLKQKYGWKDFGLSVRKSKDWLEVDGELKISDSEHWELHRLLREHREQKSRFLSLGEGEFVALTEEFHRRLDALHRAAKKQDGETLQLDPLSASILLKDSQMVSSDKFWTALQKRIKSSRDFEPKVPKTLRATLRPYQKEGFEWLARAAHRGVGCCLADDMGLGKTLQALALISSRAKEKQGPSLIVAPTSVCYNWAEEMKRFAPDLSPRLFFEAEDREAALKGLGPKDILVTSYGLLVNEIEKFQKVEWANLVLDEAQAIKNPTTKRFKAAVSLKADFRLATTGTPIENRIDEIWALFRFLNPGLLGSRKDFDKAYSGLEEMEEKRESLRRMLAPFILRRLKSQVLKDLPPRTDVNLTVELSKEEKLHYESLRLHALERLQEAKESDAISILTELTRLRRACCHPRLVAPNSKLEGAKLKVLLRLLSDLKNSGHRALIFSQFVDHLKIIQAEIEKEGHSYLYLDGSTPTKKRGKLVEEFQTGQADFFLISLMAGGTGLNLTAANYVVHLDPWWNPAVEDQASDRAHRIGQKQSVTVYRLITKDTIEEKILQLHGEKRELADSLLSGTDKASKLSAEELLNLLRDQVPVHT